jgi:AcrR family transcriptional regulator
MRKLARTTKRGLATFYNYFGSKEEVLFELQRQAFTTLVRKATESLAGVSDPADRLYAFIENHVRYFVSHPDIMQVLVREAAALPRGWRQEVRNLKERYFAIGRDVVMGVVCQGESTPDAKEGWANPEDPELERSTYGIFGMLNWVYGWYEPSRHGATKDVARTLHRMAIWGLTGGPHH